MSAPKSGFLPLSRSQGRVPNWTLGGFEMSEFGHLHTHVFSTDLDYRGQEASKHVVGQQSSR